MEQSPYWQINKSSASQEIPALYLTQSFNTACTRVHKLIPDSEQFTMPLHPTA
jgi:hypothetical protein